MKEASFRRSKKDVQLSHNHAEDWAPRVAQASQPRLDSRALLTNRRSVRLVVVYRALRQ